MSKRTNIVAEILRLQRRAADLNTPIALGGGTVLATPQHALDGPEHTEAVGTTDKLATSAHAGLMPSLSADAGDLLAGDGTWHKPTWKQPVRAASTVAGTLSSSFENGDTIDGVVLVTGDRILLKDQAAGATNGIYTVNASGVPTRATDFDESADALGAAVFVIEGTANGNKAFFMTTDGPITLGTTPLVFAALSGGGGGGGHAITEDGGAALPAEANLDLRHGFDVSDDPGSTSTRVAVDETELDHATIGGTSPDIPKTIGDAKGDLVGFSTDNTPARVATGTEGQIPVHRDAATPGVAWEDRFGAFQVVIGDGVNVIATGVVKGIDVEIPASITLTEWAIYEQTGTSGSIQIDVWKDVKANWPPTDADSVTNGHEPQVTTALSAEDTSITDWAAGRACVYGDILRFNVDSVTSMKQVVLWFRYQKV